MRKFVVVVVLALGLVALWAAILPLTAQPAPRPASPALTKALFLCRTPHGIDNACAAALAKALVIDQRTDRTEQTCRTDQQSFAAIDRRD
jgi:hypothetical protein